MQMAIRRTGHMVVRGVPLASMMLAGIPAAFAEVQQAADALEEVVVTATKRAESLQNVPASIQAFGTQKLEELQVQNFNDYTQYLPSVSIAAGGSGVTPGGSGNWRIMMRGVSVDTNVSYASTLPTVGTYLDEQPISTVAGALDVHIYDIARIEALAGPQGTLYGASSEAGTVRIITNKPDTSAFEAAYNLRGDFVAHGGAGYTLEGFVNVPLTSNAAIRVVGWDVHDAGYIDNIPATRTFPTSGACIANFSPAPAGCSTSPERAQNRFNDTDTDGARAALKVNLNDNWTVTPLLMTQDTRSHGVFGYDPTLGDLNVSRFYPDDSDDRWWNAALTVEGKISDFDVTYAGAFLKRDQTFHTDYSDYSLAYDVVSGFGSLIKNDAGQFINPSQALTGKIRYTKESHEFRITTPKDKPVRLIAGAFLQRQLNDVLADFQIADLAQSSWVTGYPDTWWLSDYKRIDRDYAEFGELSWDALPEKLTLTAGIRFAEAKNSLEGFAGTHDVYASEAETCFAGSPSGIGAPCTNFAGVVEEHVHTPKGNITYHIDKDRMLYATYSEGFRPGGLNRTPGLPPYLADYLKNYEIGWKTSWLEGRLRWNGALFWEDWDKFQFSFQGANGLLRTANGGEARIKGLESDLNWAVTHGLTLSTAFSLMDPKLTTNYCGALNPDGSPITNCTATKDPATGAQLLAPSGTQLPLTNKFKGNLQARYVFPLGSGFTAHVQGAFVYQTSERIYLMDAENSLLGDHLGAYGTTNFTTGIDHGNYSVELFVSNAFDRRALANRYTQCPVAVCAAPEVRNGGLVYDTPIQPRVIGLQFGQKF